MNFCIILTRNIIKNTSVEIVNPKNKQPLNFITKELRKGKYKKPAIIKVDITQ